jgi:hypothetical protein
VDPVQSYLNYHVVQLAQRLLLAVSAGVTPDQVNEKVQICSCCGHFAAPSTLGSVGYACCGHCLMQFACVSCLSQADGDHDTTHDGSKLDKKAATAQAIAAEENIRRVERWRYVQPFFPFVRKWTSFFLNTLKCMKSAALRLKYNDLGDFIYKMGILDVTFGRYMQRGWTHQVGYVRERFTQFSQAYVKQMSELHLKLKTFLEVSQLGFFVAFAVDDLCDVTTGVGVLWCVAPAWSG